MNTSLLAYPSYVSTDAVPVEKPARRFTLDGSDALENRLHVMCQRIRGALRGLIPPRRLDAVLLGGGYGRGEGGVLSAPDGEHLPYNDLEFYVFLRGNRHLNELRYHRPLEVLAQILTPQIGIEVEFKIVSRADFTRRPISMFSYDLLSGHRRLVGGDDLFDGCTHHTVAEDIPLAEATRLLMNRCSGLLFARERLDKPRFTAEDADFVQRNIAKAELAFGDAVLTAHGRYHWSCLERQRRLAALAADAGLPWMESIQRHHAAGVFFKLHPERSTASLTDLSSQHETVTALGLQLWLWLESLRLDMPFTSPRDYAGNPIDKCPETDRARNWLVNTKAFGPCFRIKDRPFRHPRERVLHALALLLWEPDVLDSFYWRNRLRGELAADAFDLPGLLAAYRALWARVN